MKEVEGETFGAMADMPPKPVKYYPRLSLTAKDLPALKSWEVGDRYLLVIEVEQTGVHKSGEGESEKIVGGFEVRKVSTVNELTKADFSKLLGKAKSGAME